MVGCAASGDKVLQIGSREMDTLPHRLRFFIIAFLVTMMVGTVGFMFIEKLSFADAVYFSIVTVATVGYGDIHPSSQMGRFFAIILIIMGVGTFLGVIANVTEMMLNRREKQTKLRKMHMLIGVFFSEVGTKLIADFSSFDPTLHTIRDKLVITTNWTTKDFQAIREQIKGYRCSYDTDCADLKGLYQHLASKRDFLVRLLENPVLLEQESFTELLLAVFHLTEELSYRQNFTEMIESDKMHLAGDVKRVYQMLVEQWLFYLQYLQGHYPYLFSLAIRTNPFDKKANPVVT